MAYIVDLSKWQNDVDFGKLKGQVDFVILRVQAGYSTHDSKYKEYVAGCKANNIPFGTYAYFKGVSIPDSIAEAKCAMELTDPDSKFFALDIEEKTNLDLVNTGQAFIDYLKNKGMQKVGLYSGESFFKNNDLGAIKCDFVWIAKYGVNDGQPHTAPTVPCDLWQYSSVGKVDGINTNVDLNALTGSKPIEYFTGALPAANVDWTPSSNPICAQVKVITDYLNIRQGPGNQYPVITTAKKDKIYNVTANINDWHEVIINSTTKGYAFGKNGTYLELV